MSKKARNCDMCEHGKNLCFIAAMLCEKGHKPRFYLPRYPYDVDYGWKRRCADFELGKHVMQVVV